jgi:formylglycine-generating enzyme required for sulfatase activity
MKRILGITIALGFVSALTIMAQDVKTGKEEIIDLGKGVKLEMVLIPAGKFMMGSKKNPVDPFSNIKVKQPSENEFPQHEVTLKQPFYMGKYEVTQEQWFEIMGENPSREKGQKLPVANVSWEHCQDFIKKLNASTKGGYRLPYEAEWEFACRAGTTAAYSFGDAITPKDANYWDSKIGKPVAVGSYQPNAFGLYDMHGNVKEWCEDWYGDYPAKPVLDPKGPVTGNRRVVRGGSFTDRESEARSSSRKENTPSTRFFFNGFRLARTP